MGNAAYNRGSAAIREQIDRELAESRHKKVSTCGGTYYDGPEKRFGRCDTCHYMDYEKYEGDKCNRTIKARPAR